MERQGIHVAKAIEQLLVLQECDQDIRRLRRDMQDIPLRRQQIETRLRVQQEGTAQAEHELLEAKEHIKRLEGDIEAAKEGILKFRSQQMQIKNNDEYRALEKQIATTQGQIRRLEDEELEAMEAVEQAQANLAGRKESLEKESARVKEELDAFMERSAGVEDVLAAREAERAALAKDIDAAWLSRYERLLAKVPDAAISLVEHGTCGCCHMKLSPSQVVEARKPDAMTLCVFCGRMLYSPV